MRSRPRRPILSAMKNPCSCAKADAPETNPHGGGGHGGGGGGRGWRGGGWGWGNWGGYGWPYAFATPYAYAASPYAYAQTAGDVWLPATKGPAPQGATTWVLWNGGSTGTKVRAGSAISEQVQILETAKGGVTGTLVRTAPAVAAAPVYARPYAYPFSYGYPTTIVARRF